VNQKYSCVPGGGSSISSVNIWLKVPNPYDENVLSKVIGAPSQNPEA